jgi:glucokinase
VADGTVSPVNIPGWRDFPLRDRLAELTGVPVTLANDAVCAALGEYRWGAGQGAASMLGMVISTGVGGGLILGGHVYPGPTGNAGNIGHALADPDGDSCPCGGRGCVEMIASGPALVRRARMAGWAGAAGATAAELGADAMLGSPAAVAAFGDAGRALAVAIVSAAALVDLDVVVIGGGVAAAGDLILRPLTEEYRRRAGTFGRQVRITFAGLAGPAAGLLGAAALATEAQEVVRA